MRRCRRWKAGPRFGRCWCSETAPHGQLGGLGSGDESLGAPRLRLIHAAPPAVGLAMLLAAGAP